MNTGPCGWACSRTLAAFSQHESPQAFGCLAGTLHLFIDPAGEVCPCDLTPLSFGNVLSERLEVIWQRMNSAMGSPRQGCFMKTHGSSVRCHAEGRQFPLPPETSRAIAAAAPSGPLPDYFEVVSKPFGFPRNGRGAME